MYLRRSTAGVILLAAISLSHTARAVPPLPVINTGNVFYATNYGASTASTDNSSAIQSAINAATAATAGVGGGTVEITGPGTYLSGPLTMKTRVNLQVD